MLGGRPDGRVPRAQGVGASPYSSSKTCHHGLAQLVSHLSDTDRCEAVLHTSRIACGGRLRRVSARRPKAAPPTASPLGSAGCSARSVVLCRRRISREGGRGLCGKVKTYPEKRNEKPDKVLTKWMQQTVCASGPQVSSKCSCKKQVGICEMSIHPVYQQGLSRMAGLKKSDRL